MHPRTLEFLRLMDTYDLSVDDVMAMVNRKRQTVWSWRCDTANKPIPAHLLELLKLKIAQYQLPRIPR